MELTLQERALLDQLARDLRERFGATDVRLYGSAASSGLTADSDIDLYIIVPHLTWPIEQAICDRCYEVTLTCGRLIAPCIFSQEELANSALRASPLVRAVEQMSVAL